MSPPSDILPAEAENAASPGHGEPRREGRRIRDSDEMIPSTCEGAPHRLHVQKIPGLVRKGGSGMRFLRN